MIILDNSNKNRLIKHCIWDSVKRDYLFPITGDFWIGDTCYCPIDTRATWKIIDVTTNTVDVIRVNHITELNAFDVWTVNKKDIKDDYIN